LVSIFDVTPPSFDPKHGLLRIDEFNLTLSEEERQSSNSTGPPELKKRKQSGQKKASTEEVFKRQHKAAKNIASTCKWIIEQVLIGRIRNTFNEVFEASHFTEMSITQLEMKWLEDHDTVEKVLAEYVLEYSHAPKWEPFPRACLSPEDLQRIQSEKEKFMQELEDTKKLAQSLLVRVSDSASGDRHMVGYGPNDTQWISDQLARKPKPTNTSSASAADIAIQKCNVVECNYDAVEGYCGNSGCSHFYFCDIHLNHNSHSNHEVRQEVSNFTINTRHMMFKRIQFFIYYVYPYSSSRHHH
jgi:hypothetical protein